MSEIELLGMIPSKLVLSLGDRGIHIPERIARKVLSRVISFDNSDFNVSGGILKAYRQALEKHTVVSELKIVDKAIDKRDGFVKYLFESGDGALSEAVRIPLQKSERYTVCLSSQVGCPMGCSFCATGKMGLTRNLKAWEMVSAFRIIRRETKGRITGAVFMGQGEPLLNYDEVIRAAQVLSHSCGGRISGKAISISTVGIVPKIRRFAREGHPYRLIISLASAFAQKRSELIPGIRSQPLSELVDSIGEYATLSGQRATIAWVLLSGVNTGSDEAEELARLFREIPIRMNLIDVNESEIHRFRKPDQVERDRFIDELQILRSPVVRRYSGGGEAYAACGMLQNRYSSSTQSLICASNS